MGMTEEQNKTLTLERLESILLDETAVIAPEDIEPLMAVFREQASNNPPTVDIGTIVLWKEIGRNALPQNVAFDKDGNQNDQVISEYATAIQQSSKAIAGHFKKFSAICNRSERKAVEIRIGIKIDRMNTPAEITGRIGYSEAFGEKWEVKVPDPNQIELPFDAVAADSEALEDLANQEAE